MEAAEAAVRHFGALAAGLVVVDLLAVPVLSGFGLSYYFTFGLGPRFPRSGLVNRFCLVTLASEFFVGQSFAADLTNYDREPFRVIHIPVVESARLLIDIAKQVEWFHADIGAVKGALQETPKVLHAVGMNVSIRVLDSVIDDRVLVVSLKPFVRFQFVTEDSRTSFNLFVDVLLKFFLPAIVNYEGPNFPTTLYHAHNDGLVFAASTSDALFAFRLVHIAGLPADEGFIYFDFPAQLAAALFTLLSKPDAVEQKPRGLLGYTERPRDFTTANTVLCVLKHPHGRKPFVQADGGIFHDSPNLNGELAARVPDAALPTKLVSKEPDRSATATRADNAVLPFGATGHEVFQAVPRIGKVADCFHQGLGFVKGFHTSSVPQNHVLVNYIIAENR